MSIKRVSETNLGVYVWALPNGEYLMDEEFNVLSIQAMRGDLQAITKIGQVARNMGYEGSAEFVEGARKINQEEWEYQRDRFLSGLTPDPYDIGNYKDSIK